MDVNSVLGYFNGKPNVLVASFDKSCPAGMSLLRLEAGGRTDRARVGAAAPLLSALL
ncbi:hypothetical protein SAMN04487768_3292 [Burkholderia sp. b13]|nr:hypothetical protein SAMN04487768_3253 [Burkholderia sp. b13]SIT75895.1 hypothetical protein SAMN04487768_3292 [Burkholderia sp. b13]